MKTLKNLTALLLVLVMALALCACGGDQPEDTTPPAPSTDPTPSSEPADTGMVTYTVKLADENGNPIPGGMIQLCKDSCIPGIVSDQGVATVMTVEDSYKVSFIALPEGYTYPTDTQEFYFEEGSLELTIVLKPVDAA